MGEVYQARDIHLDRQVAIKALNPSLTHETDLRLRFQNEARIQARLYHPNIVCLFEYIEQDDGSYIVMEFAPGKTLKDILVSSGHLPENRAVNILAQIMNALAYAHSLEVLHRDIKPSNIMIGSDDWVKVMDFGIARVMGSAHLTGTGLKVGTLYYMSPEQIITPRDVDLRSDIYSAGIVMYEMLTGRLPFGMADNSEYRIQKEIVENKLPDPRVYNPKISASLVNLIIRMTAKDPNRRPDVSSILASLSSGQGKRVIGKPRDALMMRQTGPSDNQAQFKPVQAQYKSEKYLGLIITIVVMVLSAIFILIMIAIDR
jgi:serine/threonine protein kinase